MADILLDVQSTPTTPASGQGVLYVDTTSKEPAVKDAAGFIHGSVFNFSTASQVVNTTTRTYITGSNLAVPTGKLQIGTCFRWTFSITKTAAGSAASTFDVAVGTAGTTADTARLSFSKPTGTAVADEGTIVINAISRGPLSASGIFVGQFNMIHNLSATGHMTIPAACVNNVSGAFDVTVANLIVGVCVTAGTSDNYTFQLVQSEAWNL